MKHIFTFIAFLMMLTLFTGCSSSGSEETEIDYIAVKIDNNGNWSFLAPNGTLKYENEFKNEPTSIHEGYFSVYEGEGYTLYKADKKPVAIANCENLKDVGYISDGLIPVVRKNSRITIVDENGKDKFTLDPINGKEIIASSPGYVNGLLGITTEENLYGIIDTKGEVVIKPEYDGAIYTSLSEGLIIVIKDNNISVIDEKGNLKFKIKDGWEVKSAFINGTLIAIDTNDHWGFFNTKGEFTKCPSKVKEITDFNDKFYVFSNGDNYGVMSRKDDEVIIRPKYDAIKIYHNQFICGNGDDYEILNTSGEKILELDDYRYIIPVAGFGLIARDKNTYTYLDDKGKTRKDCEFNDLNFNVDRGQLYSDYFSVESMAQVVTAKLTTEAYGNVKPGMSPRAFLSDPKDYQYDNTVKLSDLSGSGYRFEYTTKVEFNGYIAGYNYDYGYNRNYYWNDVHVRGLDITIDAQTELGPDAIKALTSAVEAKGYKLYADAYKNKCGATILTSSNLTVVIGGDGDNKIYFAILPQLNTGELSNLKRIMQNSVEASSSVNNIDYDEVVENTDYDEVVEVVVVD
ncbi:MAG: WG repeat-containing protein [Bacteroides sp.]|nr:WG repeat-containing protein [Bacteroides sp.]